MTRTFHEIDTRQRFDAVTDPALSAHPSLRHAIVQSVDLRGADERLRAVRVDGAVFLGCKLSPEAEDDVRARGALVFPQIPSVPVDPYRGRLYTADELYDAEHYADTFDARVYAFSRTKRAHRQIAATLGEALHDHAISDALDDALEDVPTDRRVGIMGGHALARGSAGYADAARLARAITRTGSLVFTGGGPGAMEAANLGAWLAPAADDALDEALDLLAQTPSFTPDIDAWAGSARQVRERWPLGGRSVGIPTWFYGHEPPNLFATDIAKFFANPLREATLLERCGGGIVYLPGAAGTVQEIFADACENYYARPDLVAPMVLLGRDQWTQVLPAWPLLVSLGAGRDMGDQISIVDTIEDALAALAR